MSEQPVITVTQLAKRFGGVAAVNNLSFTVMPGQIFGLLGPKKEKEKK